MVLKSRFQVQCNTRGLRRGYHLRPTRFGLALTSTSIGDRTVGIQTHQSHCSNIWRHTNGVSIFSLLTRRAETGTHRNLSTESHKPEMSSCVMRRRCSPLCKPASLHSGTNVWNPLAEKAVPPPTAWPSISTENLACFLPTSPKTATAFPASTQP